MNGGELTARLMAAAGITHSFGIMVETLVPIVQEFHKRLGGRFIAVRHEQVGASAADAFARVSGRPAVSPPPRMVDLFPDSKIAT